MTFKAPQNSIFHGNGLESGSFMNRTGDWTLDFITLRKDLSCGKMHEKSYKAYIRRFSLNLRLFTPKVRDFSPALGGEKSQPGNKYKII